MVSSGARAIRLLHVGYREEVQAVLREFVGTRNIEIVGESQTMSNAIAEAVRLRPQIVLMDVLLPDGCGLQVCRRILEIVPEIRVLFLTSLDDNDARLGSIYAGADGYILKNAGSKALLDAIESVASGQPIMDLFMIPLLFKHIRANSTRPVCNKELSRQDHRILYLVAEGKTNKEIGDALGLSDKTIKNYLSTIFQKLQVTRRSQAAVLFTQLIAK